QDQDQPPIRKRVRWDIVAARLPRTRCKGSMLHRTNRLVHLAESSPQGSSPCTAGLPVLWLFRRLDPTTCMDGARMAPPMETTIVRLIRGGLHVAARLPDESRGRQKDGPYNCRECRRLGT